MRHHVRAGILVGMLACSFPFTANPLDAQQASIPDAPLTFGAFSAHSGPTETSPWQREGGRRCAGTTWTRERVGVVLTLGKHR